MIYNANAFSLRITKGQGALSVNRSKCICFNAQISRRGCTNVSICAMGLFDDCDHFDISEHIFCRNFLACGTGKVNCSAKPTSRNICILTNVPMTSVRHCKSLRVQSIILIGAFLVYVNSGVDHPQVTIFSCDQAALWMVYSVRLSVCPSVCLSHLFDYVPIIVSSQNVQELLPMTEVISMQKVKVNGQGHRGQNPT